MEGRIVKVSGPLIVAENMADVKVYDVVKVGEDELIGEVIELRRDKASIQVYEETSGLGVGDKVVSTGEPLSVELAPGIIGGIYDGIQRPLEQIVEKYGDRITRGLRINKIDREKIWTFVPTVKVGDYVTAGDPIGYVDETPIVRHKILVPYGVNGKIESIEAGDFAVDGIFWQLLAYCAGVGGSMLIIGSAAGVVVMGLEKITFGWYMKHVSWIAPVEVMAGEFELEALCAGALRVLRGQEKPNTFVWKPQA